LVGVRESKWTLPWPTRPYANCPTLAKTMVAPSLSQDTQMVHLLSLRPTTPRTNSTSFTTAPTTTNTRSAQQQRTTTIRAAQKLPTRPYVNCPTLAKTMVAPLLSQDTPMVHLNTNHTNSQQQKSHERAATQFTRNRSNNYHTKSHQHKSHELAATQIARTSSNTNYTKSQQHKSHEIAATQITRTRNNNNHTNAQQNKITRNRSNNNHTKSQQ
jgi:hypothetical protein